MEGRLMLDGSAVEFTPLELPRPLEQFGDDFLASREITPIVWVARLNDEAGFITTRYGLDDASLSSDQALIASGVSKETLNLLAGRIRPGAVLPGDADHPYPVGWLKFAEVAIAGRGLEPVAILVTPESTDVTEAFASAFAEYGGSDVGTLDGSSPVGGDGGGPISIQRILASNELDSAPESDAPVARASLAAAESDSDDRLRLASLTSESNSVSGEWARAVEFDLAGDEPDALSGRKSGDDRLNTGAEVDPGSQVRGPLSAVEAGRAARGKLAATHAVVSYAGAPAGGERSAGVVPVSWSGGGRGSVDGMAGIAASGGQMNPLSTATSSFNGGRSTTAVGRGAAASVEPAALAEAFRQFAANATAMVCSVVESVCQEPISATPLLMVLALERIAAGNSRRNGPEGAAADDRRPKLARSPEWPERA